MIEIWHSLLANLALVSILVVAWDLVADFTGRLSKRMQSLILGVVMCAGAIISMATALSVSGFIVDLRAAFIAAAAFFGGWPAMLIATAGSIAYRIHLGGQGASIGIVGILITAVVGIAWHHIVAARSRTMYDIFGLGVSVALAGLITLLVIPPQVVTGMVQQSTFPSLVFRFLSTIIIGVLLDRQQRRRDLLMSNMIYRAMVRELPDCLNIKDVDGRFIAANPATAEMVRAASVEQLIGKTDFDFYPKEVAERFRQDEVGALETGQTLRIDQPALLPDGRQGWLYTLKAPFRDESGKITGVITYNRDITEQKRSAQLKNDFISTVSHELRTPLTSIRGSLGLISAGVAGELPPKAANLVNIAHKNSERLVLLINDILDMEKIESGVTAFKIKQMPVRPVLEQSIAASSNYMADSRIRIVLVDDAPRAEANIDPDRLHQVMANLLSNAIKFSDADGTVTVKLERRDRDMLRISVIDQGAGIPEAFRSRIFGKFEQADASSTRRIGGTGLGLSIVKAIAEKLGGAVSFETEEGRGTSFHVDLAEAHRQAEKPVLVERRSRPRDGRLRVLICEDEADVAAVIAALLDAEGFSSDVAPDIDTAKALLRSRDYVALTLDIRLAGESGIKLFHDIRASPVNSDISVIVISAVADEAKRSLNGTAVGIVDWLEKPVDSRRLHAALAKIVDGKVDRRPRILHVEDDEGVLAVMSAGLGPSVSFTSAKTLQEARRAVAKHRFDLVILDIALPDGSGLDLLIDLPLETGVIVFSAAELDEKLGDRVQAMMTKTRASEVDVAKLVRSMLVSSRRGTRSATHAKE
ncbi:hybrid sensor histidine kinase/response regulator [Mesorhizobium amorphae]|uniref:histidine kinase n=1 Tax=Mesorhizobium amorphae CCNWGS0123 TaxID=1082933 RepID=G6YCA1_9HYPH|nr:ATP-binding protein [Mesorhizobium amorphae]ANT51350.1 hybrid sensor histidine kinase/response regulator [Mesorhizobium amorphae CCNWGS0123]EHH10666.1 pas sensor protein [Mesorhizobium amorphae CCNWGS0123]GLR45173.1 hybrid sensor histidine kinase/response regulator [Mesorhizobium amorphae]